ncbi:PH domain-containing protein [Nocardioides dubius]|uniref:PH domain-containing protein n=1 Tax=Nocardioides dubius TaxID=317019 RepID=UPI0031D6E6FB
MSTLPEPRHRVSEQAVRMWRMTAWLSTAVSLIVIAGLYLFLPWWSWWAWVIAALVLIADVAYALLSPCLRYRVHRWEVTDEAVYARTGWLNVEVAIAPLSRVQTVDVEQGAIMRLYGLASVTVTTASSAGSISIDGLDAATAREVVAHLTTVTAASEGDAT